MQVLPATAAPAIAPLDLTISRVASRGVPSPYQTRVGYVDDGRRILLSADTAEVARWASAGIAPPAFELAGPRSLLFTDPREITCGIVTCGGLCPGLNNVIRSLVLTMSYGYGVGRVLGFRFGYSGMTPSSDTEPLLLTPETVEGIHKHGGTLLGSSRGPQDAGAMVDNLVARGVGVLFAIGGDGTLRGASLLQEEIARRNLPIPVIGIPKTIDNDINWVERSFGFTTAVDEAVRAIAAAHVEARGVRDGIGLVKLMGRHSGFIAAHATLASGEVNFCLIPEVPFRLEGERGLLKALEERLDRRNHAVIVVAEGAGQELASPSEAASSGKGAKDASGNVKLGDVGVYLRESLDAGFQKMGRAVTIKYIDPSYMIRSLPADAFDAELCLGLGQHAVHAAFAGRTSMMVGYWNGYFTHVPLSLAIEKRRQVGLTGALWQRVLVSTGQPGDLGAGPL